MTIQQYINSHPKSDLAKKLQNRDPETKIVIGSGTITGNPNSNLRRLMSRFNASDYIVGGRAGRNANDGSHFAVIIGG